MDLSIIIVSFNTREVLRNCLESIGRHVPALDYEVLVVDNASTDGSVEMLSREFPGVRVIANPDNRGFSRANNQGIAAAGGRHVLLLNSDTLLFDGSLKNLFDYMEANPAAGAAGCKVLNRNRTLQYSCLRDPGMWTEWAFFTLTIVVPVDDPWTHHKFMKEWDHETIREVDCLSGCFLWIRREAFDRAGLLDENFFMYYEDVEFCRRLRRQTDYKIIYYPHATIIHLGQMSAGPEKWSLVRDSFESALRYLRKCRGAGEAAAFNVLCWLTWQVEIAGLFFLSFHPKARKKLKMFLMLSGYAKN